MKVSELRQQSPKELEAHLLELRKEQFNLRMLRAAGQLNRHTQIPKVRREIAQVKTMMTEIKKAGGVQ